MTATGEIVLSGVESIAPVSYVIVRDWRVATAALLWSLAAVTAADTFTTHLRLPGRAGF